MQKPDPGEFEVTLIDTLDENGEEEREKESNQGFNWGIFKKTVLLTLIVILSGYLAFYVFDYYYDPHYTANEVIEDLPEPIYTPIPAVPADEPETTPTPVYENQVAILSVEGVDITNAPVMQHPTSDDYYLYRDENGHSSIWGSYFVFHDWNMESIDSLDRVTVIFGHSNGNSLFRKFSVLKHFRDADFARVNRYIYLTIDGVQSKWKIFAVSNYPVENNYVQANPSDDFLNWEIQQMKATSYNQYTTSVSADDKILILSTCVGGGANYETRFIVCAVYDGIC